MESASEGDKELGSGMSEIDIGGWVRPRGGGDSSGVTLGLRETFFFPSLRLVFFEPLDPDFDFSLSFGFLGCCPPEGFEESLSILMGYLNFRDKKV